MWSDKIQLGRQSVRWFWVFGRSILTNAHFGHAAKPGRDSAHRLQWWGSSQTFCLNFRKPKFSFTQFGQHELCQWIESCSSQIYLIFLICPPHITILLQHLTRPDARSQFAHQAHPDSAAAQRSPEKGIPCKLQGPPYEETKDSMRTARTKI